MRKITKKSSLSSALLFLLFLLVKLRELRHVLDALDEHDDGQVGRDEFLACLDLDHPHLMALLKATALAPAVAEGGGRGVMTTAADRRRSSAGVGGNADRRGVIVGSAAEGVGPATLSVFDAIEANDDELISWDEVRTFNGYMLSNILVHEGLRV